MTMKALLKKRTSVRKFLNLPVPKETLVNIFATAQLAPSNCNVQPWQVYVVSGDMKEELKDRLVNEVMTGREPNPDFDWRVKYRGIHRDRQFGSANALYSSMGIDRRDKQARLLAMLGNWTFFDAPHALFLTMERYLGIMGAVDMGIYAQTLALIMEDHGISSCIQGALGQFPDPVRALLNIPEEQGILFGISFGYRDETALVNATRTLREPLEKSVVFYE